MSHSISLTPIHIPPEEVSWHPHSIADSRMRLFHWQGKIYRGISSDRSDFFNDLFQEGFIQKLVERKLLIASDLTDLQLESYELIVRHRSIPFVSYSIEWCPEMIQAAALTLLDFAIELAQRGLSLEDGHLGNILFDGCQPFFVDLGSIRPLDEYVHYFRWSAYDQFCQTCFYPLVLMSQGNERVARLLMLENSGISKSLFLRLNQGAKNSAKLPKLPAIAQLQLTLKKLLPASTKEILKQKLSGRGTNENCNFSHLSIDEALKKNRYLKLLNNLKKDISSIDLKHDSIAKSSINIYLEQTESYTLKQSLINRILTDLKPQSVLDLGCHTGWYAQLAASLGSQVVAVDKDTRFISQLYCEARDRKLSILPVVMDFAQPTPAYGLSNYRYVAALERFQCQMVLALGLVHHLVFEQHPQFEQIVEGLAQLSQRWLVVEFRGLEDPEMIQFQSSKLQAKYSWYTLDNFTKILSQYFSQIQRVPGESKYCHFLLCEK